MTFTVIQLTEEEIGPESPEQTMSLGEALFQEMGCFFGVLPRLDVLNATLRDGEAVNAKNQLFRWTPFELSASEYEKLRADVLSHPQWDTDVDETFSGSVQEWSHWALVRAISK